jgi:hypothetical protein
MLRLSKTDAAYIAGFVDGEGSVGIQRMRYGGKNPAYTVSLRIYSTNSNVLVKIHRKLGVGSLRPYERKNKHWKTLWRLYILSNQAIEVLQVILPYMIIKKAHAENAIKFQLKRKRTGVALPPLEKRRQRKHYFISKRLNKRGK